MDKGIGVRLGALTGLALLTLLLVGIIVCLEPTESFNLPQVFSTPDIADHCYQNTVLALPSAASVRTLSDLAYPLQIDHAPGQVSSARSCGSYPTRQPWRSFENSLRTPRHILFSLYRI
jgi:hypothetical protein